MKLIDTGEVVSIIKSAMEDMATIRKWAWSQNLDVFAQGRLSNKVIGAYHEWLKFATPTDIEQLEKWTGQPQEPAQPVGLSPLEAIVRKIEIFEAQNPNIQTHFEIRIRDDLNR